MPSKSHWGISVTYQDIGAFIFLFFQANDTKAYKTKEEACHILICVSTGIPTWELLNISANQGWTRLEVWVLTSAYFIKKRGRKDSPCTQQGGSAYHPSLPYTSHNMGGLVSTTLRSLSPSRAGVSLSVQRLVCHTYMAGTPLYYITTLLLSSLFIIHFPLVICNNPGLSKVESLQWSWYKSEKLVKARKLKSFVCMVSMSFISSLLWLFFVYLFVWVLVSQDRVSL